MSDSTLRFLADENCDFAIVRALRLEGFEVLAVSEYTHRSDDRVLIDLAFSEQRILLTEDKDFGWLVYVSPLNQRALSFFASQAIVAWAWWMRCCNWCRNEAMKCVGGSS